MLNFHTATAAAITRNLRNTLTRDGLALTWGNAAAICGACDSGRPYAMCNCPQAREEIAMALMAIADDFAGFPVEERLRTHAIKLSGAMSWRVYAVEFVTVEHGRMTWRFNADSKRDAVEAAQAELQRMTGNRLPLNRFVATRL